ncbi:MAG: VacJ family lipoprotein [Proteobacteria bacterium]|nr:VacJ family lipoprotein [Pseudomonadota bacterium]
MTLWRKRINFSRPTISLVLLLFLFLGYPPLYAASDSPDPNIGSSVESPAAGKQAEEAGSVPVTTAEKPSDDEYGNVTEEEAGGGEELRIADPIEPFNRAIYHFNDKVYFWVWKPVAHGYKYVVPEDVRGIFSNFYENIKAPVRIVNNLLQGEPGFAAIELAKFFINSTLGVGGLRDCAKECFGINGRYADFGQTLGKYGVGFGFYLVLPLLGPSSPRDGVGWLADWALRPTTYVSSEWFSPESVGLYVHEKVNDTSFHLGEYEMIKDAAIDPYVAMRDIYIQYRMKLIER